jgi:hypothetical protein
MKAAQKELHGLNDDLESGRIDAETWADKFHEILFDGHSESWAMGQLRAGVTDVDVDEQFKVARQMADEESEFLQGFLDAINNKDPRYVGEDGKIVPDSLDDRTNLYVGKMRGTANQGLVDGSDDDAEFDWVLGATEQHCEDCPDLADLSPYTKESLPSPPGSGDTECLGNCDCELVRSDGVKGFPRCHLDPDDAASGDSDSAPQPKPAVVQLPLPGTAPHEPVTIRDADETPGVKIPKASSVADEADEPLPAVSSAFTIKGVGSDVKAAFVEALADIDAIHTDGLLPEIESVSSNSNSVDGFFRYKTADPMDGPEISVSERSDSKDLTAAHEIGHAIDVVGVGQGKTVVDSNQEFKAWRKAINDSNPIKFLKSLLTKTSLTLEYEGRSITVDLSRKEIKKHIRYLLKPEEIWARSYSQFVASRSSRPIMKKQLQKEMESLEGFVFKTQWPDSEFAPIDAAIEEAFRSLGWME